MTKIKCLGKLFVDFQKDCVKWAYACLGKYFVYNQSERAYRFFEEAVELMQAANIPRSHIDQIVNYVYERPKGEIDQEVGGVMLTLACLCEAHEIELADCAETELYRVQNPVTMARIRMKNKTKPRNSPLPGKSD